MRSLQRALARLCLAGALLCAGLLSATAQERPAKAQFRSPVLVIDADELYQISGTGQRIQAALDARGRALAEEIARIDADMAAEEKALTAKRDTLSPEEFRKLADAFDEKVQRLRREQDQNAQALNRLSNEERLRFRQMILPILGQLMLETRAVVVIEKRTVLIFNDAVDVTELVAERLDAQTAPDAADSQETPDPETDPAQPETQENP
ncbi:OmpH family outer membrane protein [Primorskyibacter aestuariivivens]|uniref:OmpH family outer membrane protein n=1 Tax=Primorskyibacter aestuariivivens TaxID=1888912 RepID=UPI0023009214|nr:OmpH family outer membrane protein [Primorskyibacter aestuariivivens]MDA7430775.1 OmpH family outer membrane protein [Primorskyibacter aestuariivivens]